MYPGIESVRDALQGFEREGFALAGQPSMYSTGTLAATGTAPAVLPAMAAAVGKVPYLVLSRN